MKKRFLFGFLALMVTFAGCESKEATVSRNIVESVSEKIAGIEALDYIKLGEYKGLEITDIDTTVTDEDVEEEMSHLRENDGQYEDVTDRDVVEEGDKANINFEGTKDGVAFEGGTADNYELVIGSGTFIPGFEDGLMGVKVGDTVKLNLTFPEGYQVPELSGQDVVFKVKVNSIQEKVLPEVTDEYISEQTQNECTSVEDYKARLKETLQMEREQSASLQMKNEALALANECSEVIKDIPQEYLDEKALYIKTNAENNAKMYNVDIETYVTQALGLTMDDFDKMCKEQAGDIAKESLVTLAIAEKERISINDAYVNTKVAEYAKVYGYESEEDFMKDRDMDQFKEYLLTDKVAQFLIDNANLVSK